MYTLFDYLNIDLNIDIRNENTYLNKLINDSYILIELSLNDTSINKNKFFNLYNYLFDEMCSFTFTYSTKDDSYNYCHYNVLINNIYKSLSNIIKINNPNSLFNICIYNIRKSNFRKPIIGNSIFEKVLLNKDIIPKSIFKLIIKQKY
jgi:hypothetical protein